MLRALVKDSKSNIAIIGSFIITALLSSTGDDIYGYRRAVLEKFQLNLHLLAGRFEFAALPLLRLNLLLERFTDNDPTQQEGDS